MNIQQKPERRFVKLREVNKRLAPFRITEKTINEWIPGAIVGDNRLYDWHVVRCVFVEIAKEFK